MTSPPTIELLPGDAPAAPATPRAPSPPTWAEDAIMAALVCARRERKRLIVVAPQVWRALDGLGELSVTCAARMMGIALASRWMPPGDLAGARADAQYVDDV